MIPSTTIEIVSFSMSEFSLWGGSAHIGVLTRVEYIQGSKYTLDLQFVSSNFYWICNKRLLYYSRELISNRMWEVWQEDRKRGKYCTESQSKCSTSLEWWDIWFLTAAHLKLPQGEEAQLIHTTVALAYALESNSNNLEVPIKSISACKMN